MSSTIDPITGLPYDALDSTLYSIPLDSQPALAPEWNPQGRINSTVYPDNLPTVFATMQAQNEQNPSTVQAATTDGAGNLNVNVKAGGGGGGGIPTITPTVMGTGGSVPGTTGDQALHCALTPTKPIYQISFAAVVQANNPFSWDARQLGLALSWTGSSYFFIRDWMAAFYLDSLAETYLWSVNELITFSPALDLSTIAPDDGSLDLTFRSGGFAQYALCETWQ